MATVVKVEQFEELFLGKPTGRTVYHAVTPGPCCPMGAVLGRGYSVDEAVADFKHRAEQDGHKPGKVKWVVVEKE